MTPLLLMVALLQAPSPLDILPMAEISALGRCTGEQTNLLDRPELTPEQVAEAALTACDAQERAVMAAQLRINARRPGAPGEEEVRRELRESRQRNRAAMIATIGERRGIRSNLDTVSTRARRYGACLTEIVQPRLGSTDSAEAIADAAFTQCAEFERRVMALAPRVPPGELEAIRLALRDHLRDQLLTSIAEARAEP